jgi:transcriptional regulator with XRE-family HTH domain
MDNVCQIFGQTIKSIREERGLSQEEFSNLIGLHRTYISPLENGKKNPSLTTIFRILDKLEIPVNEFFERSGL